MRPQKNVSIHAQILYMLTIQLENVLKFVHKYLNYMDQIQQMNVLKNAPISLLQMKPLIYVSLIVLMDILLINQL